MRVVPNTATTSVLYFCGYCGVVTAHGVCVAASTVGRDDAEDIAALPAAHRQPVLLQGAGGHAGGGVAAEQHQPAAAPEQRVDALARERDDLVGGAVAVGDVGVVAEIDEASARKALDEGAEDGEAAVA